MSFRGWLRLFFAIIVIVPMLAVGVALFALVSSSEEGKSDAQIATSLTVALSFYDDGRADAQGKLDAVAADPQVTADLVRGDTGAARARLRALARRDPGIVGITLRPRGGRPQHLGAADGVAAARVQLRRTGGAPLAELAVSTTHGRSLAAVVRRRTGVGLVVIRDGRRVAASTGVPAGVPLRSGNFDAGGGMFRARRQRVARAGTGQLDLLAVAPRGGVDDRVAHTRLVIGVLLVVFVIAALLASLFVGRALQAQVAQLLAAARRIANGDFSSPVPTKGDDEFAELGREFNRMSEQLRQQIEEVGRGRRQVEDSIRRVGAALTSGLDRQAVIELTVQTALEACGADAGHALPLDVHVFDPVAAGSAYTEQEGARRAAEREALAVRPDIAERLLEQPDPGDGGVEQLDAMAAELDDVHALAQPLLARLGTHGAAQFIGIISISRAGRAFTVAEASTLEYLAGQAVVSIENADLHETVQQQAITDELTGLANVREMNDAIDREVERGRRFDTPVGLVLLDIDDFKQVNDTYGHQQGDRVLAELGKVLRSLSRDIDEPARYGGEELAVVLPQTDADGAAQLAERVRATIEEVRVPLLEGCELMGVTASFGVASVPACAHDRRSLVAAADEALYRAKRGGRNRVEVGRVLPGAGGQPLDPATGREHAAGRSGPDVD